MINLSPRMIELALENMECGVFILDSEQRITYWNSAAERITGRRAEDVVGLECADLGCFRAGGGREGDACEVFEKGELGPFECTIARPDGTTSRILRHARVISDEHGQLLGAVENLVDISMVRSPDRLPGDEEESDETAPVPGMIGTSQVMRKVYRLTRFAAGSESTVLITGESGTGKELVARAIHGLSSRSGGPFVAVNCSALPESLLESELFGHVKGAFSGAVADKVGRFEAAEGGTIFLDEIGDISPLIQLKLLRILQNQEYQRVGESRNRSADVRVVAATNRDLLSRVRRGEFREDLFFRLKVFPVNVPPLRERKGDIPELVEHFIDRFSRRTGKDIRRISPDAMKLLLDYCWPGNVRELEHAIEYAFVICRQDEIGPFDLPQEILRVEFRRQFCPPGEQTFIQDAGAGAGDERSGEAVLNSTAGGGRRGQPARDELIRVLQSTGWNQTQAARLLGVSRVTVWNWMKKMEISRPGTD